MKRTSIIKKSLILTLALTVLMACAEGKKKEGNEDNKELKKEVKQKNMGPFFKLSLAQWSFHVAMDSLKTMSNLDFAKKGKELGFSGLEYVSQLYELEKGN